MRNIALKLSFDGTDFHGYQIQKNAHTIESEITNALKKLTNENIKIVGCGRTDSGVHAYEYFINFKTESKIPVEKFPDAINANINSDISIIKAYIMPDNFHARFSTIKKTYVYRILNRKARDPFEKRFSHKYGGEIDFSKIEQGAKEFIGTHDFSSHKSKGTETKTSIRTIFDCYATKNQDIIEIYITADGFLYNMARTISGTLLDCGTGKTNLEEIKQILESLDRKKAGPTLPANGLFMKKTIYKEEFNEYYWF